MKPALKPLPTIMVAPNGAKKTKNDHPQLPVTITEITDTAIACFQAGARGIHAHIRDENQNHILDTGLYRQLIRAIKTALPDMFVQITTESVGIYTPEEQIELVKNLRPEACSCALKEILRLKDHDKASEFYHWAHDHDIAVQHIIYSPTELEQFMMLERQNFFAQAPKQLLFVLGRYSADFQSHPDDLDDFLNLMGNISYDWAVCGFGQSESLILEKSLRHGGKCRVGFENSLHNKDGSIARDNAERVAEIIGYNYGLS